MKASKATGPDQLPIDIIKLLKERGTTWMTACLNNIIYERIPPDWRESTITPIYKQKGYPLDCRNYRGIKLLSHCLKLLERIIEQRISYNQAKSVWISEREIAHSSNVSLEDHKPNEEITAETRVMPIKDLMKKRRMRWYGHARRREREEDIRRVSEMRVEGV